MVTTYLIIQIVPLLSSVLNLLLLFELSKYAIVNLTVPTIPTIISTVILFVCYTTPNIQIYHLII